MVPPAQYGNGRHSPVLIKIHGRYALTPDDVYLDYLICIVLFFLFLLMTQLTLIEITCILRNIFSGIFFLCVYSQGSLIDQFIMTIPLISVISNLLDRSAIYLQTQTSVED